MDTKKNIFVKNTATDSNVKLCVYIYSANDPVCWLSSYSKILQPGESYFHRSEKEFKYEIKSLRDNKKTILMHARKYKQDIHINIYNGEEIRETNLEDHMMEKTVCIRRDNMKKETSMDGGRNLYEILKLNFKDIREMKKEEQDEEIKKAFKREIRRWHSDTAGDGGDDEMAREVIVAYDILRNRDTRADYHNSVNYSEGWLSSARWKSIFWSECETEEQKLKYRKRLGMMAVTLGIGIGGLFLTGASAGWASPALVAIGGICGSGLFGGSVQTGVRLFNKKSIEKGCTIKDYVKSFGLGFVAGAMTGGASVGIAASMTGIGKAAAQASLTKVGQYIGMGATSSSTGGAVFTLAADIDKKCVDGDDLSWKQIAGHALVGAAIGAVSGTAVGAVSSAVVSFSPEIISSSMDESVVPGVRKFGVLLAKNASRSITGKTTSALLGSVASIIEERIDDNQENSPVSNHLINHGTKIVSEAISSVASTTAIHCFHECEVWGKVHKDGNYFTDQHLRQKARCTMDRDDHLQWNENRVSVDYNPPIKTATKETSVRHIDSTRDCSDNCITTARFRFISHGFWKSKMIVKYNHKARQCLKVVDESGSAVNIPKESTDVEICFKVLRFIFTWCDVKKWHRKNQRWEKKPHVFAYNSPPEQRTFTLDGNLYYEKVVQITNEMHDEIDEV